ncbi:MAG: hypothetical protein V3S29_05500 [bacterium]
MIHLLSQKQADRAGIRPGLVHSISPYLNPAHALTPPRDWLEALLRGKYTWNLFRLRYKNLLRNRYRQDAEPFHALLDASGAEQDLYLTCHCLAGHCHRDLAAEFLENLRVQEPYRRQVMARSAAMAPAPVAPPVALLVASG